MESPEINPSLCDQLIFGKGGTSIHWSKTVSSMNGVGRTGLVHAKKKKKKERKKETRPPTYTIHKNKLKIDKRLKYKL